MMTERREAVNRETVEAMKQAGAAFRAVMEDRRRKTDPRVLEALSRMRQQDREIERLVRHAKISSG